jgi:filamin
VLQGFTICTIYLGTYKIDVTQGSRAVRGSPYYCQVFDASKVKIEDVGSKSVAVNEKIAFRRKYFKIYMP